LFIGYIFHELSCSRKYWRGEERERESERERERERASERERERGIYIMLRHSEETDPMLESNTL